LSNEPSCAPGEPRRVVLFSTPECELERERRGDGVAVALSGEVDLGNADGVFDALKSVIAEQPARLDVDVAALDFIDSFGISRLILAQQAAIDSGVRMSLCRTRAATRRVFVVSGLITFLNVD
jgi:anti-anti-sigma factor